MADSDNSDNINVVVNKDDSPSGSISVAGMAFGTRPEAAAEHEVWFKSYWRPAAAWLYLFINLFDFVLAPVITMILPKILGSTYIPWAPLTLANGGLFHLAFGAIIGVTAWGRTREKMNGIQE